ncbi:MAG: Gldg family protein [Treponema sp.]
MPDKTLIKKDIFSYLISPYFYICSLVLLFACCIQFFIFQRFFVSGYGTSDLSVFFSTIPYTFSLIIPVLILQISNPECENNFPFKSITIILSKLVSALIIIAIMIVPLAVIPVCVNFFGNVDANQVICSFAGIILYSILAISICLLCNEIINSKAAYVVITVVIMLLINSLHQVPVFIKCSQFFTALFNELSFIWHFDSFSKGIIDTRDVFFYLITSSLIIVLTFFYAELKKGRKFFSGNSVSKTNKAISVFTVLIFAFLYADNARIYKRFDFTKDRQFSVSAHTKKILESASEPVRITYYRSKDLVPRYPEVKDVYDYLKICASENKNIFLTLADADKKANQDILTNLNVAPQQIQSVNNNKAEYIKVYSAIVIEYLGRKEVLPFVLSTASLEFELALRFESLIKNKNHSVYVLCGNEYNSNDYSYMQLLFNSSNIQCYPIEKKSLVYIQDQLELEIPLVLFGTSSLSFEQSAVIEKFILKGGKVLLATSQYSVNINGDWSITKNESDTFIPVLAKWGIKFEDKIVNDLSNVRLSFYSTDNNSHLNDSTQYEYVNYPQWVSVLPQKNVPNGITLFWPSPVAQSESAIPVCRSSLMSWTVSEFSKTVQEQTGLLYVTNPFEVEKAPISDPLFKKEQSVLAAKLQGKITGLYNFETNENPNVIILSDQYFAFNLLLELSGGQISDFRNIDFILSMILDLNKEDELLKIQYGGIKNKSLYKITDAAEFDRAKTNVFITVFAVIPGLIIVSGIAIFIIRRRKNEKYKIQ